MSLLRSVLRLSGLGARKGAPNARLATWTTSFGFLSRPIFSAFGLPTSNFNPLVHARRSL
jgi:hypothetical protein